MDWVDWLRRCADLMAANRITVDAYRYTASAVSPGSPDVYANQALWDSCFHAITLRWIDPAMAYDELLSLVSRQVPDGPDAGMIPHMIYWRGGAEGLWQRPDRSLITQPPLIAIAARLVYQVSPQRSVLETLYPRLRAFHDWFDRRRDPDHDHLVSLIHPWESGWDASPRWDHAMKLTHPTYPEARAARLALPAALIAHQCDADTLTRAGSFSVESIDFNAIRIADLEATAWIAREIGKPDDAQTWQQRAEQMLTAFRARMMFEQPYDLEGADELPIRQESAAQFVTLFGGGPTPEQAARLVAQLQQPHHWPKFPVPTVPTNHPDFVPDVYWRGNVWPSVNWLIYMGLRRYGYLDLAHRLAERTLALVEQFDFWEYYNPLTGQGLGAPQYSWAALVLDLLAWENQMSDSLWQPESRP